MPEEREKRGRKRIVLSIIGVIIFFITIIAIASILGSNTPVKPMITTTIKLRTATEPVTKSQLISSLDTYVAQAENPTLTEQWNRVVNCLGEGCPDEAFSDTIFVLCSEYKKDLPHCKLIMNIIATNRFWNNTERVLEFSKAMTTADKTINEIGNRRITKTWDEIIKCNGKCAEKNDLLFKLIDEIIKYA
ncbi:hypothetical protein DRJ22_00490 [Candidatus Woesearchaeota archaeon]|nr:MAG: hypothetical protein B6U93_00145 [Candidatus Woesearchaeota archaeon ex4484_78]RLE46971.1 MAG: hypothetical protein DRJ22_00490 [Candidatus Woesearchaeota archaeon]